MLTKVYLAIYSKFFLIRSYKNLSIDLATNAEYLILLLAFGNIIYIYVSLPEQNTIKKR